MTLEDKINVIYNWVMAQKGEGQIDIPEDAVIEPTYEELAEDVLTELGLSRSVAGFSYVTWAVECVANDSNALRNVTKGLYTTGGIRFGVSWNAFERGIRHAIDITIRKPDKMTPTAIKIFGGGAGCMNVSNKAFIAIIASEVKKRKKHHKFDI